MKDPARDPNHWRERADQTRATADRYLDVRTKLRLLKVAKEYDRLAERAQQWQTADELKE